MIKSGKLRRIALSHQGLLTRDAFGRGKAATLRAIEHLGYVQIDTISVVARAHHHVLWSRVSNYEPKFLDQLVRERKLFEYWSHAAAWLPMRDYRYALPRMAQRNGDRNWYAGIQQSLLQDVLRRIRDEGPLMARDFEDSRKGKKEWWDWKPAKRALEQLFMQGELMVSGRQGFQKVYDLPERVLPNWVDTREPDLQEYASHLIDSSLRAHGFASFQSFTYLRKGQQLRATIREQLQARLDRQDLASFKLDSGTEVYVAPDLLEVTAPRTQAQAQVKILSPFDNAVIQRARVREVFDFDYQIECYLPEAKRQFGYFCLPLQYRDRLVGRIDCKAHRKAQCLELRSLHLEQPVDDQFDEAFAQALTAFATFNGCESVKGGLADSIQRGFG